MSADGIMMGVFGRRAAKLGKDAKYVSPSHPCLHPVAPPILLHLSSQTNLMSSNRLHTGVRQAVACNQHSPCLPLFWCTQACMLHGWILACRALAQAEKKLEDSELKQEPKAAPAIQGQDNMDRTPEQLEHQEEEPPQVRPCAGQVHLEKHTSAQLQDAEPLHLPHAANTAQ